MITTALFHAILFPDLFREDSKMKNYQITQWCHRFWEDHIQPGDFCIDATAGNGHDTLKLCQLTGPSGKVLAFDIQAQALETTKKRLESHGLACRARLILDSHSHMAQYADADSAALIVFNFGYLPSGNHQLATCADTSIPAIGQGLSLLRKGGLMSLCIYSGGDSGFDERDALLPYLQTLDSSKYMVILSQYYNRPNHPPIPVLILKL